MESRANQQHWALVRHHQQFEILQKNKLVSQVRGVRITAQYLRNIGLNDVTTELEFKVMLCF